MTWREVAVGRATGGQQGPTSWWQGWGARSYCRLALTVTLALAFSCPKLCSFYFLSLFIILKNYVISLSFHVQAVLFLKGGVNLRSKK